MADSFASLSRGAALAAGAGSGARTGADGSGRFAGSVAATACWFIASATSASNSAATGKPSSLKFGPVALRQQAPQPQRPRRRPGH